MNAKRILLTLAVFLIAMAVAVLRYRGPVPLGINAPKNQPSAARMRETLEFLLGDPPQIHMTGTPEGDAFLERLESKIESYGVASQRIDVPWQIETDPPDLKLKNLLVKIPGRDPNLEPILMVSHHDSCRWGPGAGDAGSAVVALVENIRIAAKEKPRRTNLFLFTDGEEAGLRGAASIAAMDELPFPRPVFVLNFDARGTTGGVPMFETHENNRAWTEILIPELADPKITTSLAVTVYRMLPNATDFDVWNQTLGWPGFNYATIGGAHHYHRPSDVPENLSDRTLQHFGNHIYQMRRTLDANELPIAGQKPGNAVFFDLFGFYVVCYGESFQLAIAVVTMIVVYIRAKVSGDFPSRTVIRKHLGVTVSVIACSIIVGSIVVLILKTTPWAKLRYTPVDHAAGLITVTLTLIATTFLLEKMLPRLSVANRVAMRDWVWLVISIFGVGTSIWLPGGAYLLVWPAVGYAITRVFVQRAEVATIIGWLILSVIVAPTMTLLVQALGPWLQPIYAAITGLVAIAGHTVWITPEE